MPKIRSLATSDKKCFDYHISSDECSVHIKKCLLFVTERPLGVFHVPLYPIPPPPVIVYRIQTGHAPGSPHPVRLVVFAQISITHDDATAAP